MLSSELSLHSCTCRQSRGRRIWLANPLDVASDAWFPGADQSVPVQGLSDRVVYRSKPTSTGTWLEDPASCSSAALLALGRADSKPAPQVAAAGGPEDHVFACECRLCRCLQGERCSLLACKYEDDRRPNLLETRRQAVDTIRWMHRSCHESCGWRPHVAPHAWVRSARISNHGSGCIGMAPAAHVCPVMT